MPRHKIICLVGTRPEAIKMAPVVKQLARYPEKFDTTLVSTGQHRELLDQALAAFDLRADIDLRLMQANQTLADFAARALAAVSEVLRVISPSAILVHGDTTTTLMSSLAAFYQRIPVFHVEAGLRTFDAHNPFPEEINREIVGVLAEMHFVPTESARQNLLRTGIRARDVLITGNTIVDALQSMNEDSPFDDESLNSLVSKPGRLMLVTAHRRENQGQPLREVCRAIRELASHGDRLRVLVLVHPNPDVQAAMEQELSGIECVHLLPPASYGDMLRLMRRAFVILSDSGGIQEEAPSLNTPLLILREVTERPEVVEVGAARLVGTSAARIIREVTRLMRDPVEYARMERAPNPFGDGHAARRIVRALAHRLDGNDPIAFPADLHDWRRHAPADHTDPHSSVAVVPATP